MSWDALKVYAMDDQYYQYKWYKKLNAEEKSLLHELRQAQAN